MDEDEEAEAAATTANLEKNPTQIPLIFLQWLYCTIVVVRNEGCVYNTSKVILPAIMKTNRTFGFSLLKIYMFLLCVWVFC